MESITYFISFRERILIKIGYALAVLDFTGDRVTMLKLDISRDLWVTGSRCMHALVEENIA